MKKELVQKEFDVKELKEMGLPWDPPEGGKIISDDITDTSRWSELHELIVRFPNQPENEAWQFSYSQGLTEYQDEAPWEFEKTVTGILVHEVERLVKVWEAKSVTEDIIS